MALLDKNKIEDVLWSITDRCNLKCVYCSVYNSNQQENVKELTDLQIHRVIEQLKELPKLRSIILSGGEAMLSQQFPSTLEQAKSICPNIFVISNGVQLPAHSFEAIQKFRPTIMISIDSMDEAINATTRGPGVTDHVINRLKQLLSNSFEIVVISVVTKKNIEGIPRDLMQLYTLGVRNFLLQQLHCEGRAGSEEFISLSPSQSQIHTLYKILQRIEQEFPDIAIDYNEICYFEMRKKAYKEKCDESLQYYPQKMLMCGAAFRFFAIKTNGDIIPCNALRSCILGNIYRENLNEIYTKSEELANLKEINSLRVNTIEGCDTCKYNPICDGGCRADVVNLSRDVYMKHPYCGENTRYDAR